MLWNMTTTISFSSHVRKKSDHPKMVTKEKESDKDNLSP